MLLNPNLNVTPPATTSSGKGPTLPPGPALAARSKWNVTRPGTAPAEAQSAWTGKVQTSRMCSFTNGCAFSSVPGQVDTKTPSHLIN
jgi:hypothetical protein